MADYTDDDVARLAEMLVTLAWDVRNAGDLAVDLLVMGVTPPPPSPDPADVVAEALYRGAYSQPWVPSAQWAKALVATVRDLFPADALEAAAAKVQEAQG